MVQLTGTNSCNSGWYNTYWGYYWGRWYRVAPVGVNVNWSGCSAWRTALAFSFVAMFTYLISFCLVSVMDVKLPFREQSRANMVRLGSVLDHCPRKGQGEVGTGQGEVEKGVEVRIYIHMT